MIFEHYREDVLEAIRKNAVARVNLTEREHDFIHVSFDIITASRCATLISLGAVA